MAQIETDSFSCSVCLDLLKEPVTVPCGHSYCRTCISNFWDGEKKKKYSCPQCRETFTMRPVLMKNTMLAELADQLKKSRPAGGLSFAAAEDVACDVCTGRKVKAFKSCLNCVASYCEEHLQPHHQSATFKRHRLVDPYKKLQENICSHHDEVMKMFCRTDQQCICIICSMEEHKGHNTVSAAVESTERRPEMQESLADIHKNILDREKNLQLLEKQLKSIHQSADDTVQHSHQIITKLVQILRRRTSELEKVIRSKEQTEVSAVQALQEKLKQEISELKKRNAELQHLSNTEDHIQFVLGYSSLSALSVSTHTPIIHTGPKSCFQEVTVALSQLTEHLHSILMKDWTKVCWTVERVNVLQPPEPTSRAGFLEYSQKITLDPNTAHGLLKLSKRDKEVTRMREDLYHLHHQERFTVWPQVLSRETLTERCYFEVEVGGRGVGVGVTYKSIRRKGEGDECMLGFNDKSWVLFCDQSEYRFYQNNIPADVSGPRSSRIGVYLDHTAATLSFYSVCDTMTLLHRVHNTFTEPLHMGISICFNIDDTAEICTL